MRTTEHPGHRAVASRARLRALLAACLVVALAGIVPGPRAGALAGSSFEETDGNLVVNSMKDWASFASQINCVAPFAGCAVDLPTGTGDNAFGQGAKDDATTINVVSGSIPNNKSDLERFYVASETTNNRPFVYLAWVRNNTLGTANLSIELNQVRQLAPPAPGLAYTIQRTRGDLLVLFDFSSGGKIETVRLRYSEWVTAGNPKTVCEANNTVPCWGKTKDFGTRANGSVNKVTVADTLFPEPNGGAQLKELTFGEAAVDLTGILAGCGFGSAMLRSRSSDAFNAELKDFIAPAPVNIQLPVDVTGWASSGDAFIARVFDSQLANPAIDIGPSAASSQTGPGSNSDSDAAPSIAFPPQDVSDGNPATPDVAQGDILRADLLAVSATSVVDGSGGITTQDSVARAANASILDGVVTADVITALAETDATVNDANLSTLLSGLKNLKIDTDGSGPAAPTAINNVAPNTRIDLSPVAFGPDSFVELRREVVSTSFPPPGTPLGSAVEFAADVDEVTMIHVHVTDRTPDGLLLGNDDVTTDVMLVSASAHSRSDGTLCQAVQAVEGNATVLRGNVGNLVGATVGFVAIPDGGGAAHQELEGLTLGDPALVTLGVSQSHSEGGWTATGTSANSFAKVAGLCVDLTAAVGCEVFAEALRADVASNATEATKTSSGSAGFVRLLIMGEEVAPQPGLVQEIPGVGLVVVNEQTCDGSGTLSNGTCTTGPGGARTAMTVRALRIVINELLPENPLGLTLGSEIVIAEAHSGATFVPVS